MSRVEVKLQSWDDGGHRPALHFGVEFSAFLLYFHGRSLQSKSFMSVKEVIAEIEAMPEKERLELLNYVQSKAMAEVPESFRRGMADAQAGRGVDMETALRETPGRFM
jgi:hypothetical protein